MNYDELKNNISNLIDSLKKQVGDDFPSFTFELEEVNQAKDKIDIISNASKSIRFSYDTEDVIRNYVCQLLSKEKKNPPYFRLTLCFGDDKKESEEKRVKDSTEQSDITYVRKEKQSELIDSFRATEPKYKLENVFLTDTVRNDLRVALSMIRNFEKVYDEWQFSKVEPNAKSVILFCGDGGTGKTMCAHAFANELKKKIIVASYSDIQSKYVGEGAKNLVKIFKTAEEKDAVLFFDEADSFLSKRITGNTDASSMHYNSMTNVMMQMLEEHNGIVIFATNLTANIDSAFKTRISAIVNFSKPDKKTIIELIKYHIPSSIPKEQDFTDEEYEKMADVCDGLVGRDIRNAVKAVLCNCADVGKNSFTADDFITGFRQYVDNKNKMDNKGDDQKDRGDSIKSTLEWNSNLGTVMSICAYCAWYDGEENDAEIKRLKQIAKQCGKDKPIVTKFEDFPELSDLCNRITDKHSQRKTLSLVCSILSVSGIDEDNINLIKQICDIWKCEDDVYRNILEYYKAMKQQNILLEQIETI